MAKKWSKFVWCIAYIESSYISKVEKDLSAFPEYIGITAYIPTVKILKKVFKGKNEFEEIPLLFNYGFFKIPVELACNQEFLSEMKSRISCLYGWVKDPVAVMRNKPKLKVGNDLAYYNIPIATAEDQEVSNIIENQKNLSIYDKDDIKNRKPGDIITLRGYPFEDMDAEIVSINHNKGEVKVKLLLHEMLKEVMVSFDNVFYTIYRGDYDDSLGKNKSLDEIQTRGFASIDKIFMKL